MTDQVQSYARRAEKNMCAYAGSGRGVVDELRPLIRLEQDWQQLGVPSLFIPAAWEELISRDE